MNFIATALARHMAKQSGDLFDSSKLANLLEEPVNTVVQKHLLDDADSQEYLVRMGKAMIDNEGDKFESDMFIDPDDAIFLDFENTLFNNSDSPVAAAYHNLNYYKLADDKAKDVELADSDNIFVEYYKGRVGRGPGSQLITEETKQGVAEQTVKSLKADKKYSSLFEEAPPQKLGIEQEIAAIENRDVALEKFLSGSQETNPIFRAVGSGTDFEFDTRFFNPNEIGVHAGTEGQANFLAVAKLFGEGAKSDIVSNIAETGIKRTAGDTKDRVVNKVVDKEDVLKIYTLFDEYITKLKSGMDEDSIWNSMPETTPKQRDAVLAAASQLKTSPVVVQKGYINVKNPLDLGANDGPWVGSELLDAQPLNIVDSRSMSVKIAQAISDQTGLDIEDILQTPDFFELEDAAEAIRKAKFAKFDFLSESMLNAEEAMLNKKISKWIESYGFDSIKYINNYEPSYRGEEAYSYILFKPEQYKSVFAQRFDPEDPRFGANDGGIISFARKFFERNQEIKQEDTRRTIQQGDTLARIAKETGVSVEDLQKFNKLEDPNKIVAGESIRIKEPVEKNQVLSNLGSFINPFGGDKTAEDYDTAVVDEIRKAAKNAIASGRMNIDYEDYRGGNIRGKASSPEKRKEESFIRRMITGDITSQEEAAFSVGGATLKVEDGKLYATDVYDFSEIPQDKVKDAYSALRYAAGKLPGNEFKSKIYLGEATEFGLQNEGREQVFIGGLIQAVQKKLKEVNPQQKVAEVLGISKKDLEWANSLGGKYSMREELDGRGDAARHLGLGWLAKQAKYPTAAKLAADARELFDLKGRRMDLVNNQLGFDIEAKTRAEAEKKIREMIESKTAKFMTPEESYKIRGYAKGGKVDKDSMACNKPRRTPNHPKKSHVVKACEDGKEKIIRFGEQGAKTAGKPKAGESARMKAKRKSFKARHRRNIKKGKMSAAYWADKEKW